MKTFKSIVVKDSDNDKNKLITFLNYLKEHLQNGWTYRSDLTEDYAKNIFKNLDEVSCFQSPVKYENQALVWLVVMSKEIKIANVVPTKPGKLGIDLYNLFLDAFKEDMLMRSAREVGVDIITSGAYLDIASIIGEQTYNKLNSWEIACNRDSGNLHSLDFQRWAAFLVAAFETNSKLTAKILERWLIEERNWNNEDLIQTLVNDYEYGLEILKYYAGDH
jgi:hypothetical protein